MSEHVETAIQRLQAFVPSDAPFWIAFSGGKDSVVLLDLVKRSGVPYEAHYNITTADPPELVRFIREQYPDIKRDQPAVSMWRLIGSWRMPPTRLVRYCCEELKERGGEGRFVVTGVRWAESIKRKGRGVIEVDQGEHKRTVFMEDNDEAHRLIEQCTIKGRNVINPIVDWSDSQVWSYIRNNNIPYCSLYDEGFARLGCIGCPMGGGKQQRRDFRRWPKYRANYVRAFDMMLETRRRKGLPISPKWSDGEAVMRWWTEEPEYPLWDGVDFDSADNAQEGGIVSEWGRSKKEEGLVSAT